MNDKAASPLLGPDGSPISHTTVPPAARSDVAWDKQAPTEPPTPIPLDVPEGMEKHAAIFHQIAYREGLVFDICLDRAIRIVERNFLAGLVGIDHFTDSGVGVSGRLAIVQIAMPMAIEMHKHVLAAFNELEKRNAGTSTA